MVQGNLKIGVFLQRLKPLRFQTNCSCRTESQRLTILWGRRIGIETKFEETDLLWDRFNWRMKSEWRYRVCKNGQITETLWFCHVEFRRNSQRWLWLPEGIFSLEFSSWNLFLHLCYDYAHLTDVDVHYYSPSICILETVTSSWSDEPVFLSPV